MAGGGWSIFLANLFMVHSWLFNRVYSVSLNAPSWSISCEFLFYLCFPLLIQNLNRSWRKNLVLSSILVLFCLVLMASMGVANFDEGAHIFIKTNPICRIFEFVLGMTIALAYRRYSPALKIGAAAATVVEALTLVGVFVALIGPGAWSPTRLELSTFDAWLYIGGCGPLYGLLIFVMACGKGWISRLLSSRMLVHLGEISFSLYMFHCLVLFWFVSQCPLSSHHWPTWQKVACVAVLSLLVSHINYRVIEKPCRNALTKFARNGFRFSGTLSSHGA